ncbi:MAG: glycosyltransferase [Chthoniobacteraceae bacterium]
MKQIANTRPYLLAALPCYNEADNLMSLITKYAHLALFYGGSLDIRVIVIDDASTDCTQEVLKSLPAWITEATHLEIVKHPENRGLTGGVLTAIERFTRAATSDEPPLAMSLMDGDNSHNPGNIPSMLHKILEGYDVVVASRYQPGSRIEGVNLFRRTLSRGMGLLFKLRRNIPGVSDYSCGFRLYTPEIIKKLRAKFGDRPVTQQNFSCMVELLLNCHRCGAICAEVPFLLRYDQKLGNSKMQVWKTIRGTLNVLNQ